MGAATMTSLRPAFSFATGPRSAVSARPPLSRTRRILPRRSCSSSSRMPWSRITRMSLRISAMSMCGGRAPFTRRPAVRANRTGRGASLEGVDADTLGRVVGRAAYALAVSLRKAEPVFVAGARAVRLPLWDDAVTEARGRRVRVALLPVVDAAVAAGVAQVERVADRVRPERVARVADPDDAGTDDERERGEEVRREGRVLGAQAVDHLRADEREHLYEGDVGPAAARLVEGAVDGVDDRPDEEGVVAERPARDREAVARGDELAEAPRARNFVVQGDVVDLDGLVEEVVLELDEDPARVGEGIARVREEEGVEAVRVPQPHRERAVGDRRTHRRDRARDGPAARLAGALEEADRPEGHPVRVVVRPGGPGGQQRSEHRHDQHPTSHDPHESPPHPFDPDTCPRERWLTISSTESSTNAVRPISSRHTKRMRPPADFLSDRMASASAAGVRPDGISVGRPARLRSATRRPAVSARQRPSATDTRTAAPMPIATASPCRSSL